jgi:poly-gamma-glutamate synthesis protein (capsule biosynthesis protein)
MMASGPISARELGSSDLRIALTGDVMLGRGIDQILTHPSSPLLYESYAKSALLYVSLAEKRNGPVPRPVPNSYVWGDMLPDLTAHAPDLRIINLETAVTRSEKYRPIKGIHYRMNPDNWSVLRAALVDCCVLANNHVLDWGRDGLLETLDVLAAMDVKVAGAGRTRTEAEAPAILPVPGSRRVLVYAFASPSSGVPLDWAATADRPGVRLLDEHGNTAIENIARQIARECQKGDIVIASIHWGPNWGYEVAGADREFARRLIDEAQVDIVHGHSSHHPKGIECYRDRLILYGCGDLLNDYEGIAGEEAYRPDLALLYLVAVTSDGRCRDLEMLPYRIARLSLNRATDREVQWLEKRMDRLCAAFQCGVALNSRPDGSSSIRLVCSRDD